MLPFGSLAPVIFLPILAFAYILYFIAGACNNAFRGDEVRLTDLSPENEVVITIKSVVSGNQNACSFCINKSKNPDGIIKRSDILAAYRQSDYTIIKIPDKQTIPHFQRYSLFSRPPPLSA